MKSKLLSLLCIAAGLLATGASTSAAAAEPRVVTITVNEQMKFDVTTITAAPGEEIKVVLKNSGTMPKLAMGHNWVLLKKGTDANAFTTAAVSAGAATEYIPADQKAAILANTKLIGGGESAEVVFKAPADKGDYTFVCSFPSHFALGMKGTLTVK